ncbi:MAG TPA: glycoside hydrolase family 97 protein [Chitinophagaceae bacterium]|nr:glycoside hydrolase family 97 protein [Chitinophagaceae bacterium]
MKYRIKYIAVFFISFHLHTLLFAADSVIVSSPDKKIIVAVHYSGKLSYSISYGGKVIVQPSYIDLTLSDGHSLSDNLSIIKKSIRAFNEKIISPVPEKRKEIINNYNELSLQFRQPYGLLLRVYDDGIAYRIVTRFKDSVFIKNEVALFNFDEGKKVLLPIIEPRKDVDRYHTSFEQLYQLKSIDSLTNETLAYTPVLVGTGNEIKIAITESDLEDYPGMFLEGTSSNALRGVFAPFPLEKKMTVGGFEQEVVTRRANYIAKVKGSRSFPWRVLMIAPEDKDLPGNDIVYRLASPSKLQDASWVKPGLCTDEWIININLFNVPFKSGVNTASCKYYIDFAKRFGFQRIMMDAGWSNNNNLFDITPSINMDTLSAYAKSKNIKLSMWTLCSTLGRQLDSALSQFNKWGVDFIMTDFIDRDDQQMVNFYTRIAKACAEHKLMIMFHGAYPPKGFNRTWPNAITREGVLGSEYNIWSDKPSPEHDVTLPFTRMLAGPMDYEPGILDNATKESFKPVGFQRVMSQGTRCHQLAMFIVYDNPMQIFSGNPSQGLLEPAFMELLGSLPTTWDETKILEAKVSDYIITARKKGNDWYIGGLTDWTSREFSLPLDFIDEGNYKAELCIDGMNAETYPSDYAIKKFVLKKGELLKIKMASGGGFLLKLSKE